MWFEVAGDLRFLSHHDMVRAMQRLAIRAGVGVRHSQGFNPRALLSLTCPRPVGLAGREELMAMTFDGDAVISGPDLLDNLNRASVPGLRFSKGARLEGRTPPQPQRIRYELPLSGEQAAAVDARLAELASQEQWTVQRITGSPQRGLTGKPIDLKALIADARIEDGVLLWTAVRVKDSWARPSEFLGLLGLDESLDLARAVRTAVDYEMMLLSASGQGETISEPVDGTIE